MSESQPEALGTPETAELPELPETGDEAVDAAVAELARELDAPLEQQVGVYDRMHRTLQDRLADVDR